MSTEDDLARIETQEATLRFERFDSEIAWQLGSRLRQAAVQRGVSVAIDITLAGAPLFYCAMPGATPNNAEWIRRKKNVVQRFHKSSYAVGLQLRANNSTLEQQQGAPLCDFATAGGCFPIRLSHCDALLGTITVSGLPERQDHQLVIHTLAQYLQIDPESVVFPSE